MDENPLGFYARGGSKPPARTNPGREVTHMASEDEPTSLSPTVLQVIDQFVAAMCADDGIEHDAIDRLEKLLRQGAVPKPDEINAALFNPPPDGEA